MQANQATKIHAGRVVRYFSGYGGIDAMGAIVAVHGTPNQAPSEVIGGVCRIICPDDCRIDVILFDGRRVNDVHQCSIDAPGIGVKLTDEVISPEELADLPHIAADREAAQAIKAAKDRANFEHAESTRKIDSAPLFYWNGIKDAKGEKLQKCSYSGGQLINYPAGTITIYARDYDRFSAKVRSCFAVQNDTDTQTDYFDNDRIRVIPSHPLYSAVKAAHAASKKHFKQSRAKRQARRA